MKIVRLEEGSKGRYFVHLEDGTCFPIGRKDSRNLDLKEGLDLQEEKISWIMEELVFPRGRNYLICLLSSRDYTVKEVRDKLVKARYPERIIEDILVYGLERHYLDDLRYAQDYTAFHKTSKSIRQIKYQLSMKGISSSILGQLEDENEADDLLPKVRRYWESKKGTTYEKNGKTYQYFVRKGYDSSLIKGLIDQLSGDK